MICPNILMIENLRWRLILAQKNRGKKDEFTLVEYSLTVSNPWLKFRQ